MNCNRFDNAMNNTTAINAFKVNDSHTINLNNYHQYAMAVNMNWFLKFKQRIKRPIVTDSTFFAVFIFSKINPLNSNKQSIIEII